MTGTDLYPLFQLTGIPLSLLQYGSEADIMAAAQSKLDAVAGFRADYGPGGLLHDVAHYTAEQDAHNEAVWRSQEVALSAILGRSGPTVDTSAIQGPGGGVVASALQYLGLGPSIQSADEPTSTSGIVKDVGVGLVVAGVAAWLFGRRR